MVLGRVRFCECSLCECGTDVSAPRGLKEPGPVSGDEHPGCRGRRGCLRHLSEILLARAAQGDKNGEESWGLCHFAGT